MGVFAMKLSPGFHISVIDRSEGGKVRNRLEIYAARAPISASRSEARIGAAAARLRRSIK